MKLYYSTSLVTFICIHIIIIILPITTSSSSTSSPYETADTEPQTETTKHWLPEPTTTSPSSSSSSSSSSSLSSFPTSSHHSQQQQSLTPNNFEHANVNSFQVSEEKKQNFQDLVRSELLKVLGLKKVPQKQKSQNKAYVPRAMLEEYQQTRDSVRDFIPEDRDFYGKINLHYLNQKHESIWSEQLNRLKRQDEIEVDMGPDNEATRRLHVKRSAKDLTYLTTQSEPEDVLPALEHMLPPRSSKKQKQFISVHLKFNLSQEYFVNPMKVDELESGELDLSREHVQSKARYQRIYIIQIIDFDKHNDPITRIHDSRRIDTRDISPLKFDVYDIIKYWLSNPTKNFGIIVRVTNDEDIIYKQDQITNASSKNNNDDDVDNNNDNDNHATNTNQTVAEHVILKRQFQSTSESDESWARKRPSLIIARKVTQDNPTSRTRVARASSTSTTTTTSTTTGLSGPNQKVRGKAKAPRQVDKCSMRSLSINFDDMGWSSWIIAPTSYYANYCAGDCSFPLMDQQNATNHAIIQSIFHSVGRLTPRSCCAPTKLGKMAILYQLDGTVQMRHYDDMIVESCGCA